MDLQSIFYILQVVIGFGFVIFIHEMGHFLAAKKVGITCSAFSIGFPLPLVKGRWRNIFTYRWRGTEYRLGWIPFGGFVAMQGQADSPTQLDEINKEDPGDYRNKSYWQKTLVLLGGVTMNMITAVIGFILAFQLGVTFIEPTVGMVSQSSAAWMDNKVKVGDRIIEVNGREVVDFEDVVYSGIFDGGDSIRVKVRRVEDDKSVEKTFDIPLDEDPTFGIKLPGIKAMHRVIISEAEAAKFPESLGEDRPQDGDELIEIDGRAVRNAEDAVGFIARSRGEITLKLRRGLDDDAREWTVKHTPRRSVTTSSAAYNFGMSFTPVPWVDRVRKGGAADVAGLLPGDRPVAVTGTDGVEHKLSSFGDLTRLVDESGGREIVVTVERKGKLVGVPVTPDEREVHPGRYALGITAGTVDPEADPETAAKAIEEISSKIQVYSVRPGGVADKAGIKAGDEIVGAKVGGHEYYDPVEGFWSGVFGSDEQNFGRAALFTAFAAAQDPETGEAKELVLSVQREDGLHEIALTPDLNGPDSAAMMLLAGGELRSEPVTYGLGRSIAEGFYHSKKVGYKIMMTLSGLFSGRISITHLGGPLVIAKRSYSLAGWGLGTLIFFLAFISVNLAIVNLIPLPVLDGGQWLIVTVEAIRGKPLPERVMNVVGFASFIAVIGLMLFVLGNDIVTVFVRKWI